MISGTANAGLGIDLAGGTENSFDVTANDTGDADTGPNGLQNFPVLTSATFNVINGVMAVTGTLNSTASTTFTLELFLVAGADRSGHGEAQLLLSSKSMTTSTTGNNSFTFQLGGLPPGFVLTATATSATTGNTSEFSANRTVN